MKLLAILASFVAVIASGTLGAAASLAPHSHTSLSNRIAWFPLASQSGGHLVMRQVRVAQQTGSTATPTATGTPGAQPTSTPTTQPSPTPTSGPTYPDGVTLLNQAITVYQAIKSARVELITDAEQRNVVKIHIDALADATCKGPAMKMHVKASAALQGTSQKNKATLDFVQVKASTLAKGKSTKGVWKKVNAQQIAIYGFPFAIENPLVCPSSSSSGSGTGSGGGVQDQLKDVQNMGPETFQGHQVWHVHFTDVRSTSQGDVFTFPVDVLIDQQHFIPYVFAQTIDDTQDNAVITEKQVTTKIGEKVKVKLPKAGSK